MFSTILCRRYDYLVGTLPFLCHANPCNSIAVSTQGSASRFRCCISLHFAALHNSVASRRQPPHRPCVSVRGSMPVHRASIHLNAIAKQCFASHSFALAFLCAATLYFAIPLPCHAVRGFAAALLNIACLFSATAILFNSLLIHCVAEIRIAPQSLCCSSGSKTELSLPYAVLDCAALHLSVATPCATSLFLCCAELR